MLNLSKSKKAVVEIGFSWIFILIAGTVILGLFVYIGFNQGSFFKTMIHSDMLKDLNAIFIAAQVSKNTAAIFTIPKTELSFSCSSYGIEGVSHSFSGQYVFAPEMLKTDKIISWSKPWSLGFRITNFLYLTSPYIKYYIGYEPSNSEASRLAQDIYDDFPKHVVKELLPLDGSAKMENQNYDKVIVLLIDKVESYEVDEDIYEERDFRKYKDDEVVFVYAKNPDTRTIDGSIIVDLFFKNKKQQLIGNENAMTVYDISSLYAAFISGSFEQTHCMLSKAFRKAGDVVEVYNSRTERLENQVCNFHYELARQEFNGMLENLRGDSGEINIIDLKYNIVQLIGLNEMLETYSCPLIY